MCVCVCVYVFVRVYVYVHVSKCVCWGWGGGVVYLVWVCVGSIGVWKGGRCVRAKYEVHMCLPHVLMYVCTTSHEPRGNTCAHTHAH